MQSFGHLAEQALSTERARSQQEVVKRDESIRSAKAESKIVQQEAEDLRQIIQKNPDRGEPLDNTVVMAFQGIARSIQALVRKCCPKTFKYSNPCKIQKLGQCQPKQQKFPTTTGLAKKWQAHH